jgi:hypothetical protein
MLILECSQGCDGRTNGSVTISLRNFVVGKLLQKLVISDKYDFVVIDICTFDLDILTKVFLE